jgi:uroporphyrinogen decarboxylase
MLPLFSKQTIWYSSEMEKNSLFLDACNGKNTKRPPIWFMRQAGRYLPEYQALRSKHTFVEMIHTPELAHEVTLQPIKRYGFDAAILYSDILVIAEPFDIYFDFIEGKGPQLRNYHDDIHDLINKLTASPDFDVFSYVYETIRELKLSLKSTPLLGFSGSPFTVACYLIEKQSSKTFSTIKSLIEESPDLVHKLLKILTDTTIQHLKNQINSGVNAVQIFDTWGAILEGDLYHSFSLNYIQQIIKAIKPLNIPIIVYSKNTHQRINDLISLNPTVLSVDWNSSLDKIAKDYPTLCLQGNLNPHILHDSKEEALLQAKTICNEMKNSQRFIFNLGHGILPKTPLSHVEAVVNYVKSL